MTSFSKNNLTPWQPMRYSQGSFSQFLRCFNWLQGWVMLQSFCCFYNHSLISVRIKRPALRTTGCSLSCTLLNNDNINWGLGAEGRKNYRKNMKHIAWGDQGENKRYCWHLFHPSSPPSPSLSKNRHNILVDKKYIYIFKNYFCSYILGTLYLQAYFWPSFNL